MINLHFKKNGSNLVLLLPDLEDRVYLIDKLAEGRGSNELWYEVWERPAANGGPQPIDPEMYMVGMTSDPYIIAEEIEQLDDHGNWIKLHGHLWHDPDYMLKDRLKELAAGAEVILRLHCKDFGSTESHSYRIAREKKA